MARMFSADFKGFCIHYHLIQTSEQLTDAGITVLIIVQTSNRRLRELRCLANYVASEQGSWDWNTVCVESRHHAEQ